MFDDEQAMFASEHVAVIRKGQQLTTLILNHGVALATQLFQLWPWTTVICPSA
jgi:hypothetical protein